MPDPHHKGKIFDLKLLPPQISIRLAALALDVKFTNATFTVGDPDAFRVAVKYAYGGEVALAVANGPRSLTFSGDPSLGRPNGQVVFQGIHYNAGVRGTSTSGGLSIGYGKPRIPMPWELQTTFQGAWAATAKTWGDIGNAPDDLPGFLRLHGKEFNAISDGVKAVQKLAPLDPAKDNFGAGVSFDYRGPGDSGPGAKGWNVMLYLQGTF